MPCAQSYADTGDTSLKYGRRLQFHPVSYPARADGYFCPEKSTDRRSLSILWRRVTETGQCRREAELVCVKLLP